jgi:hypothetical protein
MDQCQTWNTIGNQRKPDLGEIVTPFGKIIGVRPFRMRYHNFRKCRTIFAVSQREQNSLFFLENSHYFGGRHFVGFRLSKVTLAVLLASSGEGSFRMKSKWLATLSWFKPSRGRNPKKCLTQHCTTGEICDWTFSFYLMNSFRNPAHCAAMITV